MSWKFEAEVDGQNGKSTHVRLSYRKRCVQQRASDRISIRTCNQFISLQGVKDSKRQEDSMWTVEMVRGWLAEASGRGRANDNDV